MQKLLYENNFYSVLLTIIVISQLIVFITNYFIDPYDIFEHSYLNHKRTSDPDSHSRFNHAYNVSKNKYDTLILGTSRAHLGIDTSHTAWSESKAYNMALPALNISEQLRFIMHVNANNPLKNILIGLDYFAFSPAQTNHDSLTEAAFLTDKKGKKKYQLISKITFLTKYLLSGHVFKKSLENITDNFNYYRDSKNNTIKNVSKHPIETFLIGENAYFDKGGLWLPLHEGCHTVFKSGTKNEGIRSFEKLLHFTHKNNINLHLFVSPTHVRMVIGLYNIGLWDEFENWKAEIVASNEKVAKVYGNPSSPLWDFSPINQYNTEVAPKENEDRFKWFIDAAHYNPAYGNIIQDQIFRFKNNGPGVPLNSANINSHNHIEKLNIENYMQDNPAIVNNVRDKLESNGTLASPSTSKRYKSSKIECL